MATKNKDEQQTEKEGTVGVYKGKLKGWRKKFMVVNKDGLFICNSPNDFYNTHKYELKLNCGEYKATIEVQGKKHARPYLDILPLSGKMIEISSLSDEVTELEEWRSLMTVLQVNAKKTRRFAMNNKGTGGTKARQRNLTTTANQRLSTGAHYSNEIKKACENSSVISSIFAVPEKKQCDLCHAIGPVWNLDGKSICLDCSNENEEKKANNFVSAAIRKVSRAADNSNSPSTPNTPPPTSSHSTTSKDKKTKGGGGENKPAMIGQSKTLNTDVIFQKLIDIYLQKTSKNSQLRQQQICDRRDRILALPAMDRSRSRRSHFSLNPGDSESDSSGDDDENNVNLRSSTFPSRHHYHHRHHNIQIGNESGDDDNNNYNYRNSNLSAKFEFSDDDDNDDNDDDSGDNKHRRSRRGGKGGSDDDDDEEGDMFGFAADNYNVATESGSDDNGGSDSEEIETKPQPILRAFASVNRSSNPKPSNDNDNKSKKSSKTLSSSSNEQRTNIFSTSKHTSSSSSSSSSLPSSPRVTDSNNNNNNPQLRGSNSKNPPPPPSSSSSSSSLINEMENTTLQNINLKMSDDVTTTGQVASKAKRRIFAIPPIERTPALSSSFSLTKSDDSINTNTTQSALSSSDPSISSSSSSTSCTSAKKRTFDFDDDDDDENDLNDLEQKKKIDDLGDWNSRFQTIVNQVALFSPNTPPAEKISANLALIGLAQDFLYSATSYGKIIISEVFLPDHSKTIKPVEIGGVAGGSKYIVHSILFKFALDTEGLYGNDDAAAAKVAGHELKGLQAYFNCNIPGLCLPLVALVDYRGFRLIAISLLPINRSTIVYGSNDAGSIVYNSSKTLSRMMKYSADILNILSHPAGVDPTKRTLIHSAVDIEGHKGEDGRYYLCDFSRTFPAETIVRDVKGVHLYKLLRAEWVKRYPEPLCPDAFSRFAASEYNESVKEATRLLYEEHIPAFSKKLPQLIYTHKEGFFRIDEAIHSQGINVRMLGRVYQNVVELNTQSTEESEAKTRCLRLLLEEMSARTIKDDIRKRFRSRMKKLKLPLEDPYRQLLVDYLNLVFGESKNSNDYWAECLTPQIAAKFPGLVTSVNQDSESGGSHNHTPNSANSNNNGKENTILDIRLLIANDAVSKWHLLFRVKSLMCFHLTSVAERELSINQNNRFGKPQPISRQDLESIGERIKHLNIISNAEGFLLMMKAFQYRHKDSTLTIRYLQEAIEKFEEVLSSNTNSKVTLRHTAIALANLVSELRFYGKPDNLSNIERANEYFQRSLEQDPKDPITLYEYATFLELCGQRDLAEDYFLQVLEIDPDFIEALYHYGLLLESKNEFNYAEKFYMRISHAPKG